MNNSSSCFKFMTPFCYVLPVLNIFAINRNKLVMNFSSGFSFHMKKSNYCTNFTFGGILNRHGHFKHILQAQRCRVCGRWTQPCYTVLISHGTLPFLKKKNPLHFYWTCIFSFCISLIFLQRKTEMSFKSDLSWDSCMLFICDITELISIRFSLSLLLTVPLLTFRTKKSHFIYKNNLLLCFR